MATILVTGFPGFLGSALLPRLLADRPGRHAVCIVQAHWAETAAERLRDIEESTPELAHRTRLVTGDITRPDLGLESGALDLADIREIFHLAAVYDLTVRRDAAMRINVAGTRHILDVAESCPGLEGLHYVSTCYVSGDHPGIFTERDLDVGQDFQNHYEATKYQAERLVQKRMRDGLPATVYRPAIVVGDSRTGETQKLDGPYFVIRWILRSKRLSVLPIVADPKTVEVNLVPCDVVVRAIAHLSRMPDSRGRVYQLGDPSPCTLAELLDLVEEASGRRVLRIPVPAAVAKAVLRAFPFIGIPAPAVDYFRLPTRHDCRETAQYLAGAGISVPPFSSYVGKMVQFVEANPALPGTPMV